MKDQLKQKAMAFLTQYINENNISKEIFKERQNAILASIDETGTYELKIDELIYGAKLAWRNSTKCIGRLFWETLDVFDARDVKSKKEVENHLLQHIKYATNNGKIKSTITIFPAIKEAEIPKVKIWSQQLIRYAGYEDNNGLKIGDPASIPLTKIAQSLDWKGNGDHFDILPIIYQWNEQPPIKIDIPKESILEVPIVHPYEEKWDELQLKWYAVPIISDRLLEIGGLYYPAPFNGWYMETEIAARNLVDPYRYNRLREIALKLGMDTSSTTTYWRDRALVELQHAVYHSFKKAGVQMVDHYTAAQQFQTFREKEEKNEREVRGDWTWLIPPVSPALTPIFHQKINSEELSPNFVTQVKPDLLKKISGMNGSSRGKSCPFHV